MTLSVHACWDARNAWEGITYDRLEGRHPGRSLDEADGSVRVWGSSRNSSCRSYVDDRKAVDVSRLLIVRIGKTRLCHIEHHGPIRCRRDR